MVEALPFRALMYDLDAIPRLSDVICPPYDVISDQMREDLYGKNSFNVVRLEYSQQICSGNEEDRYEVAAQDLRDWIDQGVLKVAKQANFYLLNQTYTDAYGALRTRKVLISRVRLVRFSEGSVLPHEHTIPKAKKDRLELLKSCETNFSPIMAVYRDSDRRINSILNSERVNKSVITQGMISGEGEFTLSEISKHEDVMAITEAFQDIPVLIADGHHRYETALEYSQVSGAAGAQYVMMGLIALDDPGLDIYGYHRVISGITEDVKLSLMARIHEEFEEYKAVRLPEDARGCSREIGKLLASPDRAKWDIALLHDSGDASLLRMRADHTGGRGNIRLPIRLLEDCLTVGVQNTSSSASQIVDYDHDVESAVARVRSGGCAMGFILGGLEVDLFEKVVISEGRLPRKSTYFYPKLPAGVVMYPLSGD